MITIEDVLPTLHELFIEKLPTYIEEINKEKNDGIIILPFENKRLFENCQKLPCFKLELLEAEYSEKDRIIENTVFAFALEIKTKQINELQIIENCRYTEAIDKMICESDFDFFEFNISYVKNNKMLFKVIN